MDSAGKQVGEAPRRQRRRVQQTRSFMRNVLSLQILCFVFHVFGTNERFWVNIRTRYDLESENDRLGDRLVKEVAAYAHE